MAASILMGLTLVFLAANLYYFFTKRKFERSYFQSSLFQKLFFTMMGMTIGFAVLYYLLSLENEVLRIGTEEGKSGGENFLDYLYFSGTTMLSVGYGDLVPVGVTRFFALIQAAIGLLLPTAFFIRALNGEEDDDTEDKDKDKKAGQGNMSDKRRKDREDNKNADEADE